MSRAGLEIPQLGSSAGVESEEIPFGITGQDQVAGSGQHGGQQHVLIRKAPNPFLCDWVPGVEVTVGFTVRRHAQSPASVGIETAFLRLLAIGRDIYADFDRGGVDEASARRGRPFDST